MKRLTEWRCVIKMSMKILAVAIVLILISNKTMAYTFKDNGFFIEKNTIKLNYEVAGVKRGDYFRLYIIGKKNELLYERDYDCVTGKQSLGVPLIHFKTTDIQGYYIETENGTKNKISEARRAMYSSENMRIDYEIMKNEIDTQRKLKSLDDGWKR